MVIGLIIGLRITADQQRPEQTGGRRCETIRTGENDNSREKMQNVRGDSSAAFLSHLEEERKNGVSTRNVRLSAIHAFFHFVAARNAEHLDLAQRVLGIPCKRAQQKAIDYLEYEEIDAILKTINRATPQGSRDVSGLPAPSFRRLCSA